MPNAREQAEAVARWMGWKYDPSRPFDMRWQATRGDLVDAAPAYWRSLDAMREVEDEIERRGLDVKYMEHLVGVLGKDRLVGEWEIFRATAAQRLEAAYGVIQEANQ